MKDMEDRHQMTPARMEAVEQALFTGSKLIDPTDTEAWVVPEETMIVHPGYKTCSIPDIHRMEDCRLLSAVGIKKRPEVWGLKGFTLQPLPAPATARSSGDPDGALTVIDHR